jgi:8-oxo-dGTP diphosphatase
VKALIEHNGRYLLIKQQVPDGHLWTLPGGKVEFSESPTDALRREVDEEVSLTVDVESPVGIYDFRFNDVHIVVTVIACSPQTESPSVDTSSNPADEAIVSHEWISIDADVAERPMNKGLTQFLTSL